MNPKLYTLKSAFGGHPAGETIELDPEHVSTKGLIANGTIEEAKGAMDDVLAKAIAKAIEDNRAANNAAIVEGIQLASKAVSTSSKGPRIDLIEAEADKTKGFGDWLANVGILACQEATPEQQKAASERIGKVYGSTYSQWNTKASPNRESSGPAGGYVTPTEYTTEIWKIAIEDTILASKARKRPMVSNELKYPKLDQTGTASAGVATGYLGGVVAGWSSETNTGNQTQLKLRQGSLKAGELKGYTVITNELLQDNAAGLAAMINELFGEAIAYYTDLATLVGDGVDKPTGVIGAASTINTGPNSGGRTTAGTIVYADLVRLRSKLLPKSALNAFWVFNQTCMDPLLNMKDGSNRNIWLPNFPGGKDGPVSSFGSGRLLDLPYFFTEKTPVLGTSGDVLLVDPNGYMIGDRMSLEIAASPHVNFLQNEMTYRFIARVAGQPMLDAPFTMLDGTNQLSTAVTLN